MNTFKRFLPFLFVILGLIIIGEILVLMYSQNIYNLISVNNVKNKALQGTEAVVQGNTSWITEQDLSSYRSYMDKKIIISSLLQTTYQGTIKTINNVERTASTGGKYSELTLLIKNNSGTEVNFFLRIIPGKLKVVQVINGQEVPLDFKNLKVNDTVNIVYTVDLFFNQLDEEYLREFKIIKI